MVLYIPQLRDLYYIWNFIFFLCVSPLITLVHRS